MASVLFLKKSSKNRKLCPIQTGVCHKNMKVISIQGARTHNLKNIDLDLPRGKLIVITGPSGSGKSSLAFDTLFAEGQRRYVESLSAYARQFLERMDRPDVDEVRGISPAIAIEQKNTFRTYRSTVGTATEVLDYLRLLYARIGKTVCPGCHEEVKKYSVQDVVDYVLALEPGQKIQIAFPLHFIKKKPHLTLDALKAQGFLRLQIGNQVIAIDDVKSGQLKPDVTFVIVHRLVTGRLDAGILADSVETAFGFGQDYVSVLFENHTHKNFSRTYHCEQCKTDFVEPQPRLFSFNNPFGACPECKGFGDMIGIDMNRVIPDKSKSINQGAVQPFNSESRRNTLLKMKQAALASGISLDKPIADFAEDELNILKYGGPGFSGIYKFFQRLESKIYKLHVRVLLSRYRGYFRCPVCRGTRLRPEALYVFVGGKHIAEVAQMSIHDSLQFFQNLSLSDHERAMVQQVLAELINRLTYLEDIGLGYLTLDRRSATLSGGEAQRIHLSTALGSSLTDSLYILDEPTIGLHPKDTGRLIQILKKLRDLGNTVIVVEHDAEMMRETDQIVDLGPKAGEGGGHVVFQGSYQAALKSSGLTGQYLSGKKSITFTKEKTPCQAGITLSGAAEHNLKNINVEFPLGCMVVVTGVSGSGKSTLIQDILYPALKQSKGDFSRQPGRFESLSGHEGIDDIVFVDQSPIGRNSRSNPVTYIGAFDGIRKLFSDARQSKVRGYKPGTFSFNVPGGRCDVCEGTGEIEVEMVFLADLKLTCDQCGGKRFKKDVLQVTWKDRNIDDVLQMTVDEAVTFFARQPAIVRKLKVLQDVGLGYLRLGQSATTLSGGEAQRVKLAASLAEKPGKHVLYLFDEPTTGLHFDDVSKLLSCFGQLIEKGNSVLIIEHYLDIIKNADWIIDLGPEGGDQGGYVVAQGPLEKIIQEKQSITAQFLKQILPNYVLKP